MISCTCAANSKSNYSYKTKECWWKILQMNFKTVSSDFSWSRCLSETIHYFNCYFCGYCFYSGDKGEKGLPGIPGGKGKAGMLILLLNFWHYCKYIISKIGLFFMTNKNKNICSTYFTQGRGKKEGNFPLYLLVTFQALGKGWWHIPSCLLWGSNPAHQEAALILLDQEENPQWPQHQAWSACLTFHQHLNQILASSLPEANWPTLKALWLQDINEHGHSLQVLRVSFPELHAWIESTCLGGLQLFLSIGV